MHTLGSPNVSGIGLMVADFERLCSEEQSFGVEVARTIHEIDRLAQKPAAHAEAELRVCRMECDALRDRLKRAFEGRYHSTTLGVNQ
jgi:hypothetical protein